MERFVGEDGRGLWALLSEGYRSDAFFFGGGALGVFRAFLRGKGGIGRGKGIIPT